MVAKRNVLKYEGSREEQLETALKKARTILKVLAGQNEKQFDTVVCQRILDSRSLIPEMDSLIK